MASSSFSNSIFTLVKPTTTLLPNDFPPRLPLCRAANINRRQLIAETAAAIALPPLLGLSLSPLPAKADEAPLSEWERVFLPIDPGVVLLDIAFVPDDPNHGIITFSFNCFKISMLTKKNSEVTIFIFKLV